MKTRIFLIIGIFLLSFNLTNSKEIGVIKGETGKGALNIFTSADLQSMTAKWVSEYSKLNPGLKMQLITASETDIQQLLKKSSAVGFISDESLAFVNNVPAWNMIVGRDVIVPVMNQNNPLKDEIFKNGITSAQFGQLIANPKNWKWGVEPENQAKNAMIPAHYYFVNDQTIISRVSNFVHEKNLSQTGIKFSNEQKMISAIQKDPYGIGFCRLNSLTDQKNHCLAANISLVPVDKNGNGRIDYSESIYENLDQFSRGVWIGKFPMALSGKIYSISSLKPKNASEISFLNWVLTDGQQYLASDGFNDLVLSERKSQLDKIHEPPASFITIPSETNPSFKVVFLILISIGLTILSFDFIGRRFRIKNTGKPVIPTLQSAFKETDVLVPQGLYFDKTHTWAFMKKDGLVKIGIDDFLQHVTGPVTRIEFKNAGETIKKGDHLFTIIQNGKQLKIYSPVTGKIAEQNKELLTHAGLLNNSPFADGWIYLVEPANWLLEIQFMSMAEKYSNWIKAEYLRLKDFFESAVRVHVPAFIMVLQDGGVLRDGILAELGPEVWEDFQTKFIDTSR